ncbi:MAG: hypothetical protein WAU69_09965 [Solirubrobacteraceae bacterium]
MESGRMEDVGGQRPLRVAFVGQEVYFRQCAMDGSADSVASFFVDFRAAAQPGPLMGALEDLDPDIVLVFRPEIIPQGLFGDLRAVTLGYLTEPLPRGRGRDHSDLDARMSALRKVDPTNFDRIVSFDPLIAQTAAAVLHVWQSAPLPVADCMFMDVRKRSDPPSLLFIGRSTEHREHMLGPIKQTQEVIHIGHGLFGAALTRFLAAADVQVNLHNNPYPTFENRVTIALAAGHLVISEPLSPSHGLRAGVDYLEVQTPEQLLGVAEEIATDRDAYAAVQAAGREQAERFRASRVYPPLLRAALEDVQSRGGRH